MAENSVSIIITILNGEKWIESCFRSIAQQTAVLQKQIQPEYLKEEEKGRTKRAHSATASRATSVGGGTTTDIHIEVCVFDDCSTDGSARMLCEWQRKFEKMQVSMCIVKNESGITKGVGYGRNKAISAASGSYLCFQDIDDEMLPTRISEQYHLAKEYKNSIIGSQFTRIPPNSTCRFSRWANDLPAEKLTVQIYTSHGPTVIMPTWFCHRSVYDNVPSGFCEAGHGTPEDLIFFYEHLDRGGSILRVAECLLHYRYHPEATTFSINRETIWRIRLKHVIGNMLNKAPWTDGFTIWNAGKQGRKFFRDLPVEEKKKVLAFCDVDQKKISKSYKYYDKTLRLITHCIPIVHFTQAKPPLLICMKLDLTNGAFENNLNSLNLKEGKHYILFS